MIIIYNMELCHVQDLAPNSQGQGHDFDSNLFLYLKHLLHICVLPQTSNNYYP